MSQSDFGTINPTTKSGPQLATDLNGWRDAVHSLHKGSTAPSYVAAGMMWLDDSSGTSWVLKLYDGTDWITQGTFDTTANSYAPEGAEAGDVVGPASTTDNAIPRYDTTTGKLIQNSGIVIDDDDNLSGHGAKINAQTGTTYTLTAADNGKVVTLNNAAAITLTLPQTSTTSLAQGFQCTLVQRGAGQVTVAKEGTDTVESKNSNLKLTGQHSIGTVVKLVAGSPNTWGLYGDLSA